MYNRQRAKEIAYAESRIPKDKLKWVINGNKFKCCQEDIAAFERLNSIYQNALNFVNDGHDLLIFSPTAGNGKTTWACKIAINYINQFVDSKPDEIDGCPIPMVMFVNVPEFFTLKKLSLKDTYNDVVSNMEKRIERASLVIWDDVASKGTTEYEDGILYIMLNKRIENGRSNIYTSNVPMDKLQDFVSGTVASRITQANRYGNCIGLSGMGMRGFNINDNY